MTIINSVVNEWVRRIKPIKISVRKIVEFILREGNIDSRYFDASAMYSGTAAHKKIQSQMSAQYKKEISLSYETIIDTIPIIIQGRADGIITDENGYITVDEIKSTTLPLDYIYSQHQLHMAQAKFYAYMYCIKNPDTSPEIKIQLTYYQLESEEIRRHIWDFSFGSLKAFVYDVLNKYAKWIHFETNWKQTRDASIVSMTFPFATYRRGQRELAVATYRSITNEKKLYVSAPTGIGKTLATVFPAIKTMGESKAEKIFYLTAKTITRTVAEDAVKLLSQQNLQFKSITLRAKEKICINHECICSPEHCPQAKGHYDRINDALEDILNTVNIITPETTKDFAKKHAVCPHEFGLDCSLWSDMVIGDYNHLFDPGAYLRRFFNDEPHDYVFLIDEAHNLADRVRDMYSTTLNKHSFSRIRKALKDKNQYAAKVRKTLRQLDAYFTDLRKDVNEKRGSSFAEFDAVFKMLVMQFIDAADAWLLENKDQTPELYSDLLNLYFECMKFQAACERYDEHYENMIEMMGKDVIITLFCLDPSKIIESKLKQGKSTIMFSATLTPLPYFKNILGGASDDTAIALPSPFEPSHLNLMAHIGISTKYTDRQHSYVPIAHAIYAATEQQKGNYFVFFSSYEYMNLVFEQFTHFYPQTHTLQQTSAMTEEDRHDFLKQFDENNKETLIGFTVLGGVFSEGIDLRGNRLIGSIIIGVGIPMISLRQERIMHYFNKKNENGYDYAYTFPGMNKVLQAAGRVIRTEEDKGMVLLIDDRYVAAKYKGMMPPHWHHIQFIRNSDALVRSNH